MVDKLAAPSLPSKHLRRSKRYRQANNCHKWFYISAVVIVLAVGMQTVAKTDWAAAIGCASVVAVDKLHSAATSRCE